MEAADEPDDHEPTKKQWVGFWSMIAQQTQNAFNDKAAQFILVPLGGAIAYTMLGVPVESWAGIMIALPFVLFAPLAGWLSDRYSKRDVMVGSAVAQLVVLVWLCSSIYFRNMPLALCGFFALAVQSAFFSPAKIGINKELVGSRHLGFASGIQQMMSMLAILAGQIAAGVIYDQNYRAAGGTPDVAWQAAMIPLLILAALALPSIVFSIIIPRTPAQEAEKLTPGVAIQHFRHLADLWSDRRLRQASFGVAFFWGFASFINLWSVKLAKVLTAGQEGFGTLSSWFMAAASLGMVGGFGLASFLLRRRIELGWVPVAGVAMTLCALGLMLVNPEGSLDLLDAAGLGWLPVFKALVTPHSGAFLWMLALLAFFAAIFLAPLNAWMQDRYPATKRGELQSASNLQDCMSGIIAVGLVELIPQLLRLANLSDAAISRISVGLLGLGCGLITWFIIRLIPSQFVRVIGLTLIGTFYRIRGVDTSNLPEKGGVLLLPNHISWGDAFFLTAASPRPIRFVMEGAFMANPLIRGFCKLFNTVPISTDKPREALKIAANAIKDGHVVCIFPEGQLSRTGTLQELKRGLEIIARLANCPSVPVWADGSWGSILSFERNRFFTKIPHRIPYHMRVAFGKPIAPDKVSLKKVRSSLLEASAASLASRLHRAKSSNPQAWANGYQLGQINALQRRTPFTVLPDDPTVSELVGLASFASIFKSNATSNSTPYWLGGNKLRQQIASGGPPSQPSTFFDFSEQASTPLEVEGWHHCPCLAINGIIISMSLPDPTQAHPDSPHQVGGKEGSVGILLPGFSYEEREEHLHLTGPAAGPDGIPLPKGTRTDESSFVFLP
ncbi:MFS transporter [Haloferula chungangensis]|uniref:MFS transporter n=1 Tax=Haloferula chungangensis TaxID=1048331 RepID=A0ABW2L7S9_9BACT